MYSKKSEAISRLNELNSSGRPMNCGDYNLICNALSEIETLRDRDEELEELWARFRDVPMNTETERIEAPFMGWGPGVSQEEILHWFDVRHSKGVAYLLYSDGIDRTDQFSKMVYLKQLCPDCESASCGFNYGGVFPWSTNVSRASMMWTAASTTTTRRGIFEWLIWE